MDQLLHLALLPKREIFRSQKDRAHGAKSMIFIRDLFSLNVSYELSVYMSNTLLEATPSGPACYDAPIAKFWIPDHARKGDSVDGCHL